MVLSTIVFTFKVKTIMIKITSTTITMLFVIAISTSQNLINNPSFELFSQCPSNTSQFFVDDWERVQNSNSSPDQYNTCAGNNAPVGVPENVVGFENPEEGDGYIGIFVYGDNSVNREYIQTQLQEPLVAGATYVFSFYVSVADLYQFGANNIGALFRQTPLEGSGQSLILANPQVNAEDVITEKDGWTLISESFVAQGGEEYVAIGNFFSDEDTQNVVVEPFLFEERAYFLIDSVSLEITLNTNDITKPSSVLLTPNPTNDFLKIALEDTSNIEQLTIFDVNGREIQVEFPNSRTLTLSTSRLPAGVYFLKIVNSENVETTKRIIKN